MLGKIAGAVAGRAVASRIGGPRAGTTGAIVAMALPMLARRLGPLGMIGVAVGSWAVSRALARRPAAGAEIRTLADVSDPPVNAIEPPGRHG